MIRTLSVEGIWQIFEDRLPIVIYTGHSLLQPATFERFVPLDNKINGTSVSPTLRVDLTSISTLISSTISCYLCLPLPVCLVHFVIEELLWRISVNATLRGVNEWFSICWLEHQPSHGLDDVSTAACERPIVIVIPSHLLESMLLPLPASLIMWHGRH
jgi:hypothetical protein